MEVTYDTGHPVDAKGVELCDCLARAGPCVNKDGTPTEESVS